MAAIQAAGTMPEEVIAALVFVVELAHAEAVVCYAGVRFARADARQLRVE